MNHYEALGVPVGAAPATVRQAYLDAARRHHPDFHADAAEATREKHAIQMQVINQAWAVLGRAESRERYDLGFRTPVGPTAERVRNRSTSEVPEGKGWTPRADDDGWMDDYQGWMAEDERPRPDRAEAGRQRGAMAVVPVALFVLAVLAIFLGMAMGVRGLIAGGFAAGIFSAVLFVIMPVIEMSRSRYRR